MAFFLILSFVTLETRMMVAVYLCTPRGKYQTNVEAGSLHDAVRKAIEFFSSRPTLYWQTLHRLAVLRRQLFFKLDLRPIWEPLAEFGGSPP